ncbi:MAG: phosphatase PAP2 family protein [Steroidobacteraceae bacterium]|jgi:membrane-associated phospholipid phosphatase|nr:phosphatase PAP2 family protein [Steroidobacteraceae bacterium]
MPDPTSASRGCRAGARAAMGLLAAALGGCATTSGGPHWGAGATAAPGWSRLRDAAVNAATDPRVWVPLAGAAALQVGDADREISDWAREHAPVFGSARSAEDWSDRLRIASAVAYAGTVLATAGSEDPGEWLADKTRGVLGGVGALALTSGAVLALKSTTGRERPNGEDDESFPSGNTATTAVLNQLSLRNLQSIEVGGGARRALALGLDGLTVATAWSRVEAGAHYPSDTLVSMAISHFIGMTVNDAFVAPRFGERLALGFTPMRGQGAVLTWSYTF